jgi:hypothetical protein
MFAHRDRAALLIIAVFIFLAASGEAAQDSPHGWRRWTYSTNHKDIDRKEDHDETMKQ